MECRDHLSKVTPEFGGRPRPPTLLLLLGIVAANPIVPAVAEAASMDGPKHPFEDELLDRLVGSWDLTGRVAGQPAHHGVTAQWILAHQFLQIQETSVVRKPDGKPAYEAMPIIGYDRTSDRYVAHWLDDYGGRFSETLGYGWREGNRIAFTFEYPDGPFHTVFEWLPVPGAWHWAMEQKGPDGRWQGFADMMLRRK